MTLLFLTSYLSELGKMWIWLFSHCYKASLLWRVLIGGGPKSFTKTRWCSKWKVYRQHLEQIEDVRGFVYGILTEKMLLTRFHVNRSISYPIQIKLWALTSFTSCNLWCGEPFVKAIYVLEENSSLVFSLLGRFQAVSDACQARLSHMSRRQVSQ